MGGKLIVIRGAWMVLALSIASLAATGGEPRLADALEKGNKEAARALLKEHADVNVPQPDGATALHWVSHWNDLETADLLIDARANVNAANDNGVTPLFLACTNGSSAMVEKLLNAGADANAVLPSGETALMTCSWTGNIEAVNAMLARGADPNRKETLRGQTSLMWALEQKHLDAARALIGHGADVNARSKSGFTPLLFAAKQGDLEAAKLLLTAGANVNEGTPVSNRAANRRSVYAPKGPDGNPIPPDASTSTNSAIRLEADSYGSSQVPDGITPLVMAAASGHEDLALFLLEKGAEAKAADGTGATALHYALLKGMALISAVPTHVAVDSYVFRPNMVRLIKALLAKGADPNARLVRDPRLPGSTPRFSMIGATPFLLATATGDLGLMRYLVEMHANPLLATNENTTPLMVAAGLGNFEDPSEEEQNNALQAARMAVELGADVNAVGENGWTALHGAAYTGADAIAQFLVEKGAKLDVRDVFEQTPLSIAEGQIGIKVLDFTKKPFGPHPSTAKLLRKLGADPLAARVLERPDATGNTGKSNQ